MVFSVLISAPICKFIFSREVYGSCSHHFNNSGGSVLYFLLHNSHTVAWSFIDRWWMLIAKKMVSPSTLVWTGEGNTFPEIHYLSRTYGGCVVILYTPSVDWRSLTSKRNVLNNWLTDFGLVGYTLGFVLALNTYIALEPRRGNAQHSIDCGGTAHLIMLYRWCVIISVGG